MVMGQAKLETEVVVVGGGPGGYVAAIRAADLGKDVVLVDERGRLGGVCLHEGCIPSKALINAVETAENARFARTFGIHFDAPRIDVAALRGFAEGVITGLENGIKGLLAKRGVEVVRGRGRFSGPHTLEIPGGTVSAVEFEHAIVATGSRPNKLPNHDELGLWTATEALLLERVPEHLVVVGGGYIGLELGLVYAGLGSRVTVVHSRERLLKGVDADIVDVMVRHCKDRFDAYYESRVKGVERAGEGYRILLSRDAEPLSIEADAVLAAIGRKPNSVDVGLDAAGVKVDDGGFVVVDAEQRTSAGHVFAIGDVVPGPGLAHKASREGKVAAEVICGHKAAFDNRAIPCVVFTDPEIAWTGLTEEEARAQGRDVKVGRFPLKALGRARTLGRTEGLVKVIAEASSGLVLGVGLVGPHVSELVSEGTLAVEMGATLEDLMVTIHPHPTLSEAIMEAAEVAAGAPIHQPPPKKA